MRIILRVDAIGIDDRWSLCCRFRVLVKAGKAAGVQLKDGREIESRIVVSGVNPKLLYERLIGELHRACFVPVLVLVLIMVLLLLRCADAKHLDADFLHVSL